MTPVPVPLNVPLLEPPLSLTWDTNYRPARLPLFQMAFFPNPFFPRFFSSFASWKFPPTTLGPRTTHASSPRTRIFPRQGFLPGVSVSILSPSPPMSGPRTGQNAPATFFPRPPPTPTLPFRSVGVNLSPPVTWPLKDYTCHFFFFFFFFLYLLRNSPHRPPELPPCFLNSFLQDFLLAS